MAIDEAITLKKLEVFLAFMRLNNMARVSEALGLSTVSVHRALHTLEEGTRCALFKREGRNLIPLPAAHVFAEYARRTLDACEEGVRKVRESAGFNAPRLCIGSLYSLTLRCVPQLMIRLKLRKPELEIDLTLGSNRELLRSLEDGRLDAIIIGLHGENQDPDLVAVPMFQDHVYLAAPVGSRYADQAPIALDQLRHEKFVALTDGFVTAQDFEATFELARFRPDVTTRVQDIFSLINLVGSGLGYSLLPGRVAEFSPRIQLIELQDKYAAHQRITLLLPRNRERDPNLLALAAECRIAGREGDAPVVKPSN